MEDDPQSTRIQMLATLVATATYAAGFNPPGGVWQDIHDAAGHLPGDPIMRSTHYLRYAVFFYCNAVAFTLSLIIVVVTLSVTAYSECGHRSIIKRCRGILMVAATLALMVAYGAGACRDKLTIVWYSIDVAFPFVFVIYGACLHCCGKLDEEKDLPEAFRKLTDPLSMFALTISYLAGLSTPGGFWDSAEGGHGPGDAILGDRLHGRPLKAFFIQNNTMFVASLYGVAITITGSKAFGIVFFIYIYMLFCMLSGLLGAYIVGSSRWRVNRPLYGEIFACMVAYVVVHVLVMKTAAAAYFKVRKLAGEAWSRLVEKVSRMRRCAAAGSEQLKDRRRRASLVQLMAGLAVAITYQAGLYPPGGLWAANADGHTAGDPILLTTNARRYKGFYYCNSVSFVASLLAIFLAQKEVLHEHHALEAAMILDMLGLIGSYAIGSCRDQVSTLYVAGLAGAGVVYVFVHVSYFTLGDTDDRGAGAAGTEAGAAGTQGDNLQDQDDGVENLGGQFLLFAILVASITYQAGLTPPGGFLLKDDQLSGHHAGDPVLLYNYPRRYRAFFYCNSVSFMLSIVLILLLVNPNQYRPAIRSHAMSVCSAVSYVCLMGAFASGSTQHLTGFNFIFALAGLPSLSSAILLFVRYWKVPKDPGDDGSEASSTSSSYSETSVLYLMTLAILVASATYPAGLDPPGGSWQSSSDGHDAGNPVMHDSRRHRYLAFLIGNTASFFASIMLILALLLAVPFDYVHECLFRKWVNGGLVSLQCLGFLVAYAAGSSRQWKTSAHIGTLLSAVLLFVAIHVSLSVCRKLAKDKQRGQGSDHGEVHTAAQTAPVQGPV